MSLEMLQARENLMEAIQVFLKKYDQIHPKEKSMALLLAEERFLKIKQAAAKVSSQYWKPPIFYDDDDDDDEENYVPLRDIISELPFVKDLNLTPSESEDLSDNESECDMPVCDDSSPNFTTFSNHLFDSNDDFTSSDDESFSDENVPKENFKIYSNPLFEFDEEIISSKIDPLYNEINSIPQGNDNDHFNVESDLIESLLNRDTSMVSSPKIDSLLEEFSGYHDSEGDIIYLESLLINDTIPNLPPKVFLDHDPRSLSDISDLKIMVKVFDPWIHEENLVFDTLLPFSSENEDKVFNLGILISKEEKSPPLLSHRGFKVFQLINDSESPMMIYGEDIHILDVPFLHFYPP
ncbi:hypothetical protein Tco_1010907 [Tanacetum coccineum]